MPIHNKNYELVEEHFLKDLNSTGYLCKHKKTGARVLILSNDDDNKVFSIGFRTPPVNDTGLTHILEHSVLCGSKKYPAKDPFVELCKGSLNTFLNAMTYPDKTVYPVASCNDVDFHNIVDVYLDAVFHPNIYEREEIFRQEGWHYELFEKDGELTYNGVVYNEMKGALSDPDDQLQSLVTKTLFPDNAYGFESGGDPEAIPQLSYEEFLKFHSTYYHPSNSYIYLYGDLDVEEYLTYLDEEYLCHYDQIDIDTTIKPQTAFAKTRDVVAEYAVNEGEDVEEKAILSYNVVVGNALEKELGEAFEILDFALFSAPGAPVKQALVDAGIGTEVYGSLDPSMYQPVYSIVARDADENRREEFLQIIRKTLEDVVREGINPEALAAGINYYEFRYREADYGSTPKGLNYGLVALDSWLYDDAKPYLHLELNEIYDSFKKKISTGYFENIIQTYLLDNTHAALVTLRPVEELTKAKEEKTKKELEEYKKSLSDADLEEMIAKTKHLKEYQDEPSTPEELETIPMLRREDLKVEPRKVYIDLRTMNDQTVCFSNLFTNGICYYRFDYDMKKVPEELLPYASLAVRCMGLMSTEKYHYRDLFTAIHARTGGLGVYYTPYGDAKDYQKYRMMISVSGRAMYEDVEYSLNLVQEILGSTNFRDEKRLHEIVSEQRGRMQAQINGTGHSIAIGQAASQFSPMDYYNDKMGGLSFYRFITELDEHFEEHKEEVIAKMQEAVAFIFCKANVVMGLTCDEDGYQKVKPLFESHLQWIKEREPKEEKADAKREFQPKKEKIGYMTSSQVNYVARFGNFLDVMPSQGTFTILRTIFGYEYLWLNVRVKGGAYGCMSAFSGNGNSYMVSYRDPNVGKTNEIFQNAAEYVKNFTVTERDMTKYIIGTIGDIDMPLTPRSAGHRSYNIFMSGRTLEDIRKERMQILNATQEDIRALAPAIQKVIDDDYLVVVGNSEAIKADAALFDRLENLS
ncbi:MAG: insulinase family protein [Lachnospiraceae bacterium]|nr:insulinase family protein [Lachnospiraceae bacterium]